MFKIWAGNLLPWRSERSHHIASALWVSYWLLAPRQSPRGRTSDVITVFDITACTGIGTFQSSPGRRLTSMWSIDITGLPHFRPLTPLSIADWSISDSIPTYLFPSLSPVLLFSHSCGSSVCSALGTRMWPDEMIYTSMNLSWYLTLVPLTSRTYLKVDFLARVLSTFLLLCSFLTLVFSYIYLSLGLLVGVEDKSYLESRACNSGNITIYELNIGNWGFCDHANDLLFHFTLKSCLLLLWSKVYLVLPSRWIKYS